MPSYRFCRPDDIPRLIAAIDACYRPHVADEPPMTVARFRAEMKELDLWPSSCLLAREGDGAVAVLIATKRPEASLVLRVGVLAGHERKGHGSHLLTSLSQKLAVLGPERLVVELPRDRPDLQAFFAAACYTREAALTDWLRAPGAVEGVPAELVAPITAHEADRYGLLEAAGPERAWERQRPTLVARDDLLTGVAIVTPARVEACVLFDESGDGAVDLWFAGRHADARPVLLDLLLRHLADRYAGRPLRLPRLADDELSERLLAGHGFEPAAAFDRWSAVATPG